MQIPMLLQKKTKSIMQYNRLNCVHLSVWQYECREALHRALKLPGELTLFRRYVQVWELAVTCRAEVLSSFLAPLHLKSDLGFSNIWELPRRATAGHVEDDLAIIEEKVDDFQTRRGNINHGQFKATYMKYDFIRQMQCHS